PDMTVEGADVNQPPQPQAEQSTPSKPRQHIGVALIGPPGSGKGAQSRRLAERFGLCHVDIGAVLRGMSNNGSVKLQTEQGRLVDDKLVSDLVSRDLDRPQCSAGFVLDGFPRTIGQAERLDSMLAERSRQLDAVVQLDLSPELAAERVTGRLYHLPSGRVYHHRFSPPKRPGHDNETGEPLAMRPDDFPDVMQRRLASHFESSAPVLQRYERLGLLKRIDASRPANSVWQTLLRLFPGD
ncbi:hypothetical protein BOX15_Mlig031169g3, partial [Macrostomum lignano]